MLARLGLLHSQVKDCLNHQTGELLAGHLGGRGDSVPIGCSRLLLLDASARGNTQTRRHFGTRVEDDSLWVAQSAAEGADPGDGHGFGFRVNCVTDVFREGTPEPV